MTATAPAYVPTEQDLENDRSAMRCTLEEIDRTQVQVTNARHRLRNLLDAAKDLNALTPQRVTITKYDLDCPGEPTPGYGLNLPESTQVVLSGSYSEPVRELIAAAHAADAQLAAVDEQCEVDRARVEDDLRSVEADLRNLRG